MSDRVKERLERDPTIQRILREIHESRLARHAAKVDADPESHKTTRLMEPGRPLTYRAYPAGTDELGREVSWCYSCWRNRVGYFLTWREVTDPVKGAFSRGRWAAHKKRSVASKLCARWAKEDREK